jgi:hypothetical protein
VPLRQKREMINYLVRVFDLVLAWRMPLRRNSNEFITRTPDAIIDSTVVFSAPFVTHRNQLHTLKSASLPSFAASVSCPWALLGGEERSGG